MTFFGLCSILYFLEIFQLVIGFFETHSHLNFLFTPTDQNIELTGYRGKVASTHDSFQFLRALSHVRVL